MIRKSSGTAGRRRLLGMLLLAALTASLALAGGGRPAGAQSQEGWSTPLNLSKSDTASVFPDIAVDSAGHAYVVWGEFSGNQEGLPDLLMFRAWNGHTWSWANDILVGGHLPQIAVDSHGRLHVVDASVRYIRTWAQDDPASAHTWSQPQELALRAPYWPDMIVDRQDRVHVVFRDTLEYNEERTAENNLCVSGCRGIYYVRSTDGGDHWTLPVQLDTSEMDAEDPRLASDRYSNVYAVWSDTNAQGTAVGISFSYTASGGASWARPQVVAEGDCLNPQVAVDSAGTIHVAWRYGQGSPTGNVGYTASTDRGKTWSPVEALQLFSSSAYAFGLAVDSADTLHLVLPLASGDTPVGVYHLARPAGGDWSAPAAVAQNLCNAASNDVELAVGQGNRLYAVWYDREECKLGFVPPFGRGEVYYSTLAVAAPATPARTLPPAPTVPTVAATITATAAVTSTPAAVMPTATGVAASVSPANGNGLAQAGPGWVPAMLGIGAAAGVVLVVVLVWSRGRRSYRG